MHKEQGLQTTMSSTGTTAQPQRARRRKGVGFWFGLIVLIGGRNALPPAAIVSIFIFGPLLAAVGASAYAEGSAGVRDLWPNGCDGGRASIRSRFRCT